ncbi:hypothetical protein [Paenibacillus monticola]|uniref:Glycosyltransferase RgtA/B/C/D-like domain-containing protein n=1 Tax=Paenibacillus monticola TaxID=2666075 RepID=A0A7X2H9T5_9BACL|nr:hypothetical protein [Paenibacillus monticola]MRN56174.1 hypothetical protein [Paenibacillus monticola]
MELEKNNNANLLTTYFTIIFISVLIYFIHLLYHPISNIPQISTYFDTTILQGFVPEPVEKMQYMASLIALPFIIVALHLVFKKMSIETNYLYIALFVMFSVLVYLFLFLGLKQVNYYFVAKHILYEQPLLGSLLSLLLVVVYHCFKNESNQKLISISTIAISVYVSIYIAYLNVYTVHSVGSGWLYENHFNALYYSVAAVMHKHSLFVNLENQYGLFPEILRPLFKITGLTVHKFTFVMFILIGITFLSWLYFLYSILKQKWIAFIGFMTIMYFGYLFYHTIRLDSYFQYYPVRTIFPSLLLLVTTAYLRRRNNIFYYIGWVIFPIGILWNFESGFVTFMAWFAFLLYKEFAEFDKTLLKRVRNHIVIGVVFTFGIFSLYSLYILMVSGHIPNYSGMINYVRIFYNYGFAMMPMPLLHPWNLVVLVYLVGLVISIKPLIDRKYNSQAHVIFMISILGFGLFSYYQGRSHDEVFSIAYYPAFLLIPIYADRLIRSKLKVHIATAYIMLFVLTASTITAFIEIPYYGSMYEPRVKQISTRDRTSSVMQVEFIKRYIKKGDAITILSFNSGVFYGETGTVPELNVPGPSEMFFKKDFEIIQNNIRNKKIDRIFLDANYLNFNKSLNEIVIKLIKENYVPIDASEDKQMVLYQKQ